MPKHSIQPIALTKHGDHVGLGGSSCVVFSSAYISSLVCVLVGFIEPQQSAMPLSAETMPKLMRQSKAFFGPRKLWRGITPSYARENEGSSFVHCDPRQAVGSIDRGGSCN